MLNSLSEQLHNFVTERNWDGFHHPQSLGVALSIECGELAEHFVDMGNEKPYLSDPERKAGIEEEIADVLNVMILLSSSLKLDLYEVLELTETPKDVKDLQRQMYSLEKESTPISAFLTLSYRIARLLESFIWLTTEESRSFVLLPRDIERLKIAFQSLLNLAHILEMDVVELGLAKLQIYLKKFPIEEVSGRLVKHKGRTFTNPSIKN